MKIAVCFSGGIRYPHIGLKSLQKIIPNDFVKIFIHTWSVSDRESFLKTVAGLEYKEKDKTLDDNYSFLQRYNCELLLVEKYDTCKIRFDELYKSLKFSEYHRDDVGPISMHYSISKSNQLRQQYEKENGITFDWVIRMRFDSDFEDKTLDLTKLSGDLCIPEGEDWYDGINDQFAIGTSYGMNVYCNFYNNLSRLQSCIYHPETMLRRHLEIENINVTRFDFPVRINNKIDFRKVMFG
jgi:hypothetical protein